MVNGVKVISLLFVLLLITSRQTVAQSGTTRLTEIITASDADSTYIATYKCGNDVRLILGGQGAGLSYQSTRDHNLSLSSETYNNVTDLVGFGLSYKIIDFDLTFSLPKANLLPEDRQNLKQFRLSMSYTTRKNSFRGYLSDSEGVISSEPAGNFTSAPNVSLLKIGVQITHVFNAARFSYRAANFQNERQLKTAGSLLVRIEPFYRKFGADSLLAATNRDIEAIFGNQAGLKYVNAPGVVVMPGYGATLVKGGGKYYVSPMVLLGPGVALNTYKSEAGKFTRINLEVYSSLAVNLGYNGVLMYGNFRASYDVTYSYLNPSIISTADVRLYLTIGYRFRNLEKIIPTGFF